MCIKMTQNYFKVMLITIVYILKGLNSKNQT